MQHVVYASNSCLYMNYMNKHDSAAYIYKEALELDLQLKYIYIYLCCEICSSVSFSKRFMNEESITGSLKSLCFICIKHELKDRLLKVASRGKK